MRSNVHHRHRSDCEIQRELIESLRSSRSDFSVPLCVLVRNAPISVPKFQINGTCED
jgi:hypothetical protein